jgi:hypothetical protein
VNRSALRRPDWTGSCTHFTIRGDTMRTHVRTGVLFFFAAGLALADTYTGVLVDAACPAEQKSAPVCNPTPHTTSFALIVPGDNLKTLKLDAAGNAKAAAALKNHNRGADRSKDPNTAVTSLIATVVGSLNGEELRVESIQFD